MSGMWFLYSEWKAEALSNSHTLVFTRARMRDSQLCLNTVALRGRKRHPKEPPRISGCTKSSVERTYLYIVWEASIARIDFRQVSKLTCKEKFVLVFFFPCFQSSGLTLLSVLWIISTFNRETKKYCKDTLISKVIPGDSSGGNNIENCSLPVRPKVLGFSPGRNWSGAMPIPINWLLWTFS